MELEFKAKFGNNAKPEDVFWKLSGKISQQNFILGNLAEVVTIQRLRAMFLAEEGEKSPFTCLFTAQKMELEYIPLLNEEINLDKLKLVIRCSKDACEECLKQKGRIITYKEAVDNMPIPRKMCSTIEKISTKGFCKCRYEIV